MAIRFLTSQNIQAGTLTVSTIDNLATASNVFLVSDGGLVKYRTAAQVRSDIGAGTGSGTVTSVAVTNGTGISASVANASTTPNITITNSDRGSSQNIFKNFAVSGQSTIVAANNNDTLNFAAGANVTITTNATTDVITIASSYVDTNNFPTSLSWDTGTGILALGRSGLSTLTVDLDNRYAELGTQFTNKLTKWSGSNVITASNVFENGNGVGIFNTNPNFTLDVSGSIGGDNIFGNRYYQQPNGVPTSNLGNPSITEMALFDTEFNNKTAFYDPNLVKFYTSPNGVTWTEYTGFSINDKKAFVGGDNSSNVYIPNLTPYFSVEVESNAYVFLNALYIYWSSNSHSTTVKTQVRRVDNATWYDWTTSNNQVSSWPGHLYMPFNGVPFLPGPSTSTGHYDKIRFVFNPTWAGGTYSYTNINLFNFQIWGGYPAGKRNIYATDSSANVTFPGTLAATSFLGNATSATTAGNADTVDGYHASTSTIGSNIVVRDPNGYIFGNYINLSDDGNPGGGTSISSFITKQGDNYYRSVSPTNAMVSIRGVASGSWGINITGNAEYIASNPGRTDSALYPVVWSNGNTYSPNYSCAAVTIQSSTGKLTATSFSGAGTGLTGTASGLSIGGNATNVTGVVAVANGGTGSSTAAGGLSNLGGYPLSNPSLYINTSGARSALSFAAGSGAYNSTTGVITIPTDNNQIANSAGYITSAAVNANYASKFTTLTINGVTQSLEANRTWTIAVGTVTGVTGTAPIVSSGGTAPAISITAATTSAAGSMSAADKTKLDGIAAGAQPGTVTSVSGTGSVSGLTLTGTFTTSGSLTLGGTLSLTAANVNAVGAITNSTSGNAATATALSSGQSNWSGQGVLGNVVGMLAWKNYGNSHVIFDASNSTTPSGTACNNANPQANWAGTYPTLMGWNGSTTYGVRVDSARVSDSASAVSGTVAIANGGTGSTTAAGALSNLGGYPSSNPSGYTANTGTVTSIVAGTGLSGGTISTTGTIALANTAVTAGSYTAANITVDAQGRITAASNGSGGGGISGSGTTNYIPKFTGATAVGNSNIFINGNNVGVNTTAASSRFTSETSTSGPAAYSSLAAIFGTNTSTDTVYNNQVGVAGRVLTSGGKAIYGDASTGAGWAGWFDGKGYFSANVGIATTTPSYPLDVNGIAILRNALYMTSGGASSVPNWSFSINGSGDLVVDESVSTQNFIFSNAGQVLIGTTVGGTPTYGQVPHFVTSGPNGGTIDIRNLNTTIGAGTLLGRLQFTGKSDTTVGYSSAAIEAVSSTTAGTGNGGGGILKFMTANTGAGQAPTARMWINQAGYITIGSANTGSHPLRITTQVSNISILADYDIVAFSDQSVKENIRPIENVIERVQKSRGVLYDRIDNGHKDNIGFIAQELEVAFPELVVTNEDGTKAVKYQNAVAVMFEAIKEQQKQINELKELVTKLIK